MRAIRVRALVCAASAAFLALAGPDIVSAGVGPAPPVKSGVRPPIATSDKARILALEARFAAAVNAKDVAKIMSVYDGRRLFDFDVFPPRQYVGGAAFKTTWNALVSIAGPIDFKVLDLDIDVVGSVAYSHAIQDAHWTGADGKPVEMTVRVTRVYRKTGEGWRIVQEHTSVPVDPSTGQADMLSKP